ncbi:MAG: hypothetical protein JSW58_09940 [Candidatus Latescibacterota bacterium]|nr:MAG: hypothetical protein JSW58_09940 [Candidatus Latescibacterota bacterium]
MGNLALRIILSVMGGGAFYTLWLAVAIPKFRSQESPSEVVLMVLAPLITAMGYGVGTLLAERLAKQSDNGVLRACVWPLVGCVVGAAVVYPFGPMLIVFGMFVFGTAAVAVREFRSIRNRAKVD